MTIANDVDDNDANDDDESSQIYVYCWGLFFRWSLGKPKKKTDGSEQGVEPRTFRLLVLKLNSWALVGLSFSHVDSGKLKYRDSWEPRFLDSDPGKLGKTRGLQVEVEPSHYYWGRMGHHWVIVLWNMFFFLCWLGKTRKKSEVYEQESNLPPSNFVSNKLIRLIFPPCYEMTFRALALRQSEIWLLSTFLIQIWVFQLASDAAPQLL